MTNATNDPESATRNVDDPAELDRFLDAYVPTTVPADWWKPFAPDAVALVKRAGKYHRARVQNDISVVAHVAARLLETNRPLTLDEALADSTLLDFDLAQARAGIADGTRGKARGILRRLQAVHHGVPWRKPRAGDGERIVALPQPTLATDLRRVMAAAEQDSTADAAALLAAVDVARRARRGEAGARVTADAAAWRRARACAARHEMPITAAVLAAAVTHELLQENSPVAMLAAAARLTRRDLDLGLTHAANLPRIPSPEHRAALRGRSSGDLRR